MIYVSPVNRPMYRGNPYEVTNATIINWYKCSIAIEYWTICLAVCESRPQPQAGDGTDGTNGIRLSKSTLS